MKKQRDLSKPTTYLRGPVSRGIAGKESVDREGGDYGAGIVRQAAVITRGEALGHDMWVDTVMLQQTHDALKASGNEGIKARFTHPGLSSDGLGSFLGRFKNPTIDGDVVRADLHFSKSAHKTPDGDLASYVMDLAEGDPAAFGNSIVFRHDASAEEEFEAANQQEVDGTDGRGRPVKRQRFQSPDPKNTEHLRHARVKSLRAVDAVDSPAANPSGFFHATDVAHEAEELIGYALGLSEERPKSAQFDVEPDRVSSFVKKFLDQNNLEVRRKDTDMKTGTGTDKEEAASNEPRTFSAVDAKRYVDAFGAQGAIWLGEGKEFGECEKLHAASELEKAQAELSSLKSQKTEELSAVVAERDALKTQLAAAKVGGEAEPVSFSTAEGGAAKTEKKAFSNLPDGLQRYAASLKKTPAK
jgi:hypothetical protein